MRRVVLQNTTVRPFNCLLVYEYELSAQIHVLLPTACVLRHEIQLRFQLITYTGSSVTYPTLAVQSAFDADTAVESGVGDPWFSTSSK
jgi:hypothetical protein